MLLCHGVKKNDEMIGTIFDLAIATWACGDRVEAAAHLYKAVEIAETVCRDTIVSGYSSREFIDTFKLLSKCYSALVCLLTDLDKSNEALCAAENLKSLPERLLRHKTDQVWSTSATEMLDYVTTLDGVMLYYFITAGHLFRWCVAPKSGVSYGGCTYVMGGAEKSVLTQVLLDLQNTLGVPTDEDSNAALQSNESSSEEKFHFLQMLSLSKTCEHDITHISTGKGCLMPFHDTAFELEKLKSKPPVYSLYEFLISPFESELRTNHKHLVVVADGELLQVPFSMLKKRPVDPFLSQQFELSLAPSFKQTTQACVSHHSLSSGHRRCVTINLALEHACEEEAQLAARIFGVEPISGSTINKTQLEPLIGCSEVLHFACRFSWGSVSGVVLETLESVAGLAAPDFLTSPPATSLNQNLNKNSVLSTLDFLTYDLSATKLVVLGAPFLLKTEETPNLALFVRCLLSRGAAAVLFSLWPVPETASKVLLQNFFEQLASGCSSSSALSFAVNVLRSDPRFEHPSYWAGFVLAGRSTFLDARNLSLVHALNEILRGPPVVARESIKLLIHLLNKSSQKDDKESTPTYVSQVSYLGIWFLIIIQL